MSNYVKATNFASKDSLPTSDPAKIVKGVEIDNEYNAIASAISSKADTNSPTLTGTPLAPTAASGTSTNQIATTAFVAAATGSASNIAGGGANRIVYQTATDTTGFTPAPTTVGTYLGWTGTDFTWSTVSASTSAALTANNSGAGDSSGMVFNGSFAKTISYNTVGAPSVTGTGATGTWGISITGSSGSTSYATSAGTATTATTATTASGLSGTPNISVGTISTTGNITGGGSVTCNSSGFSGLYPNSVVLGGTSTGIYNTGGSSFGFQSGGSNVLFIAAGTGSVTNVSGSYTAISDARIKHNITPARNYLSDICKLNVVNYSFINDNTRYLGFVAQEVEAVMPGLVDSDGKNSDYPDITNLKSVKTSVMIPMLIQAVQDLKAGLDAANAKIAALENA